MAWLLRDGEVLAAADVVTAFGERLRIALGPDHLEGAVFVRAAKSAHTLGTRTPIDVAFCDRDLVVVSTRSMRPRRVGLPCWRAHSVIEAEAGAFERWRLRPGDHLELRL
jgi:uncharacterized membrane protein (UPF0127 family)